MHIALFILYACALAFLLSRSAFMKSAGLPATTLSLLFLLYAATGCLHLWIAFHYFPNHGDIWQMFDYSTRLKVKLLTDLPAFEKDFFPQTFSTDLVSNDSGWAQFQMQGLVFLHIIFNFLSFNNHYINVLLFCFITMWGRVAFYKTLLEKYPGCGRVSFVLSFLLPTLVFWTSVIHKEGIVFFSVGIILYSMHRMLHTAKKPLGTVLLKYGWQLAGALCIVFITRKIVLVMLLPALAVWWASEKTAIRLRYIALSVVVGTTILLALLGSFGKTFDIGAQISARQHEFLRLEGSSRIPVAVISDDVASFTSAFPVALLNGLFMPLPGVGGNALYLLFAAEILAVWITIGWCLYLIIKSRRPATDGFALGLFLFAFASCIVIGYTVPFAGAIVRYRSIYYPFLLLPFVGILTRGTKPRIARPPRY